MYIMANYLIDDSLNFNFNNELNKLLNENTEVNDENNLCLISNTPLTENYVTLNCNHKYNYIALFKDICNEKSKANIYNSKLKINEIRCPYCRKIQDNLLPYNDLIKKMNIGKVNGVNNIDINQTSFNKFKHGTCCFNTNCNDNFVFEFQDGKDYCYFHKKEVEKQILKEKILQKKEEMKQAKLKEKEEMKQAKLKEKEEMKQSKLKEKEEMKQAKLKEKEEKKLENINSNIIDLTCDENIIISNNVTCKHILKSGPRKGLTCGVKIKNNCYCGRHTQKN